MTNLSIITVSIALLGLCWSILNTIIGKIITAKIKYNDLKHLTADVEGLKESEKEFKIEIKNELHDICLAIKRIEKRQVRRDAVCNERHKK